MRLEAALPALLILLLASCAHPVRPAAGEPVRVALSAVKTRAAEVVRQVASSSPQAAVSVVALQQDLAAAQVAFDAFEKRYATATSRIAVLDSSVTKLTSSRNFWRGVTSACIGTILLCIAILVVPKIP
jgi:hypothetical protein